MVHGADPGEVCADSSVSSAVFTNTTLSFVSIDLNYSICWTVDKSAHTSALVFYLR